MIEMELVEIQLSHHQGDENHFVLRERDGERTIPIYIGQNEARAADDAVLKRQAPRPLTHDLVVNVVEGLEATLEGVIVDSLDKGTFHGKLIVRSAKGSHIKIDSRPSDAIVLAMKVGVPIYVAEEVLDQIAPPEEF